MTMRTLVVAGVLLLAGSTAFAADGGNSQQSKMAACNTQAAGKTGDERKAFMSDCLKAKPAAPAAQPLDPKAAMSACNKAAGDKKLGGDARKNYMSACLKAKGPDLMTN